MQLAERKGTELAEKLSSMHRELDQWRAQSERDQPLEKHHTQIRAIANTIDALTEAVEDRLQQTIGAGTVLADAIALEVLTLEVHRVWHFFRSKLALRYVDWFRPYLLAADELAWSCYQPAQRWISDDAAREPPLVFFNGGSSPFTMPRGVRYQAEEDPEGTLPSHEFTQALRQLPVAVIGIPWFQIAHLPDAPVIAHEVGHDVEEDLRLTASLLANVNAALEKHEVAQDRRPAWRAWLGEIFADVYGTLATGPAFVSSLIDFIAADASQVTSERLEGPNWGLYPTRSLRVLVGVATLRHRGLAEEGTELWDRWRSSYPDNAMAEFEPDTFVVVSGLLDGAYDELGGKALTSLVDFSAEESEVARRAADAFLRGRAPTTGNVRCLTAAARLAYDDKPEEFLRRGVPDRVLKKIAGAQKVGVRTRRGGAAPREGARDDRDAEAGRRLFNLIVAAHEREQ